MLRRVHCGDDEDINVALPVPGLDQCDESRSTRWIDVCGVMDAWPMVPLVPEHLTDIAFSVGLVAEEHKAKEAIVVSQYVLEPRLKLWQKFFSMVK